LPILWWTFARHATPSSAGPLYPTGLRAVRMLLGFTGVVLIVASFWTNADSIGRYLTEGGKLIAPISARTLALWTAVLRGAGCGLLVLAALQPLWRVIQRSRRRAVITIVTGASSVVFAATFALVSPYSLRKLAFVKGLYLESVRVAADSPGLIDSRWIAFGGRMVGPWIAIAAVATVVYYLMTMRREGIWREADHVLVSWTLLYGLILVSRVHDLESQYVLPLIPPCIMLAVRGVVLATSSVVRHVGSQKARRCIAVAVLLTIGLFEWPIARGLAVDRRHFLEREKTAALTIAVGRWLDCYAPHTMRIAYDHLAYVPPTFQDVRSTRGGTMRWLEEVRPHVVVVHAAVAEQFDTAQSEKADYYRCLHDGSCGFERLLSAGQVSVYARRSVSASLFSQAIATPVTGVENCRGD
jgi:hypothetical protein